MKTKQWAFAFYKAEFGDGKVVDDGISVYTTAVNVVWLICRLQFKLAWKCIKNRYSHVEVWKPDGFGNFTIKYRDMKHDVLVTKIIGDCFTSTLRDGAKGTVIRPAAGVIGKHPERWDIVFCESTEEDYAKAVAWADWQARWNKGYSKKQILGFFWPFRRSVVRQFSGDSPPDWKNICSVAAQGFAWVGGMFSKWFIWSPLKLWYKCYLLGKKTIPLVEFMKSGVKNKPAYRGGQIWQAQWPQCWEVEILYVKQHPLEDEHLFVVKDTADGGIFHRDYNDDKPYLFTPKTLDRLLGDGREFIGRTKDRL